MADGELAVGSNDDSQTKTETGGEGKERKERIRKKRKGGKLLRQLGTERVGAWRIDRLACVHPSPEDKT